VVSKEERSWFEKLDERPEEWTAPFPAEQLRYMIQDVEAPFQIADQQTPLLEMYGARDVVELENACLPAVAAMEARGALIDQGRWRQVLEVKQSRRAALEQDLTKTLGQALQTAYQMRANEIRAYQQALREEEKLLMHLYTSDMQARRQSWEQFYTGSVARWKQDHPEPRKPPLSKEEKPINLGSSAQVLEALGQLGIAVTSTREEVLEEYAARYPLVAHFLAWRKLDHFCQSFGESLLAHIQDNGRIHAHFAQIGAVSGRIICSRPNLQQIPKKREHENEEEDIRRCFIAPPGYQFLKSDLSNIELRILAEVSEDATMLRFFAEGKDLHAETARLMFHLSPETDTRKHLHQGTAVREIAKAINYGLSYGMGAARLAQRLNIPVEEARELMRVYFTTYPGVDRWLRRAGQRVRKQGYAASLAGRRRAFTFEHADQAKQASMERMARNHPIQATNADILKQALGMLIDLLPEEAHLVLAVHDEIVLECPDPLIEETEELLKEALVSACRTYLKVVHIPEPEVLIAPYWKKE
jgi:DNA polymerase-1